jgi:hypothetical protein
VLLNEYWADLRSCSFAQAHSGKLDEAIGGTSADPLQWGRINGDDMKIQFG